MKRFIQTLQNIWRIAELREKLLVTAGLLLVYRLGSNVVLPGIDPESLGQLQNQASEGLVGLINAFSGGAFANASVLALGIMPYISASIVIQLAGLAVPSIQKMQKEGESGRRKLNQITRYLTILIVAAQAPGYITNLLMQGVTVTSAYAHLLVCIVDGHHRGNHLRHVVGRAHHRKGYRQRYFLAHHDRYRRHLAPSVLPRVGDAIEPRRRWLD